MTTTTTWRLDDLTSDLTTWRRRPAHCRTCTLLHLLQTVAPAPAPAPTQSHLHTAHCRTCTLSHLHLHRCRYLHTYRHRIWEMQGGCEAMMEVGWTRYLAIKRSPSYPLHNDGCLLVERKKQACVREAHWIIHYVCRTNCTWEGEGAKERRSTSSCCCSNRGRRKNSTASISLWGAQPQHKQAP